MASVVQTLTQRGLLRPPPFLPTNMMYETLMGSVAYGVSGDTSDRDVYGFAIPPRDHLFPHLAGEIAGFGKPRPRFENFQVHHVRDPDALAGKGCEYDFSIYSIPRFFTLCLECNPNMIDSLFTPQDCVLHQTHVGSLVRERRHLFLHQGVWTRFKSYAYAQLHKMRTREPEGKRAALREQFGFDVKARPAIEAPRPAEGTSRPTAAARMPGRTLWLARQCRGATGCRRRNAAADLRSRRSLPPTRISRGRSTR